MNQKSIQYLPIGIIIVAVLISGYIILKPSSQTGSQAQNVSGLAPMVGGKQVLSMTVKAVSYNPNYFKEYYQEMSEKSIIDAADVIRGTLNEVLLIFCHQI